MLWNVYVLSAATPDQQELWRTNLCEISGIFKFLAIMEIMTGMLGHCLGSILGLRMNDYVKNPLFAKVLTSSSALSPRVHDLKSVSTCIHFDKFILTTSHGYQLKIICQQIFTVVIRRHEGVILDLSQSEMLWQLGITTSRLNNHG